MEHIALDTVDSTNDYALALWRKCPRPLRVTARTQNAGVGRSGRPWLSPAGGVWMTIAWPLADAMAAHLVPLIAGVVVRDILEKQAGVRCWIKWPNDLLLAGKKIAGILCLAETQPPGVLLIGIGINAAFVATELAGDLRQPATTLLDEVGQSPEPAALAAAVADELATALVRPDLPAELSRVARHLAWINEAVTFTDYAGNLIAAGIFKGIDTQGRALVDAGGPWQALDAGEMHFQRAAKTPPR